MAEFLPHTLGDLFDLFEGESPAGAGSAAALTGREHEADLAIVEATLRACGRRLVVLVNRDRDAYKRLVEAYRLPPDSGQQQNARQAAVQTAMQEATQVPLEMMDACCDALRAAVVVATHVPVRARGEVSVGVELLKVAFHSAGACLAANIPAMVDADLLASLSRRRTQLDACGTESSDAVRRLLSD